MSTSGAVIMTFFATVWWVVGVHLARPSSLPLYAAGAAITGAIVFMAFRRPAPRSSEGERSRQGRLVGIASGAEGLLIFVVANILGNIGRTDLIASAVAIIVGLHFSPLAWKLPAPLYFTTGTALLFLGIAGCFVQQTHVTSWAICLAAASILWITSALVLSNNSTRSETPPGLAA